MWKLAVERAMWYSVSEAVTAVGALVVVVVGARVVVGATVVVGALAVLVGVTVVAVARLVEVVPDRADPVVVVADEEATVEEDTLALVEVELDASAVVLVTVPAPAL